MKRLDLSVRELLFVVGTRAALGVGLGLLAAGKLGRRDRLRAGGSLLALGILTTIPAVLLLKSASRDGEDGNDGARREAGGLIGR